MEIVAIIAILSVSMTLITPGLTQSTTSTGCPDGWTNNVHGEMCYKRQNRQGNYEFAKSLCNDDGGEIIMPKTKEEDDYLSKFISWEYPWIGLTDVETENIWIWKDNESLTYSNWKAGRPTNNRGHNCAVKLNGVWWDISCNYTYPAVFCQRKNITCTNETNELNITGTLTKISGYHYNDILTYSCEPPYKAMDGDLLRTCTLNGSWSGAEPLCKGCTDEWTTNTLKCYKDYGVGYTYAEAVEVCRQDGREIVMPKTKNEDEALAAFMNTLKNKWVSLTTMHVWIGLTDFDKNRKWTWNTNETLTYEGWTNGQPDNNVNLKTSCVSKSKYRYNIYNDGWHERLCTWKKFSTICQREIVYCTKEINAKGEQQYIFSFQSPHEDNLTDIWEPPFYKLLNGNWKCMEMGNWCGIKLVHETQEVVFTNETKTLNKSGTLTDISGFNLNDNITYSCMQPYHKLVAGYLLRTCNDNGTWSGTEPVCEKVTCTNDTSNLNISGTLIGISGYNYNDNLTFSCEPPYNKLIVGDLLRACDKNGNWSGTEPVCKKVSCINEMKILNISGKLLEITGYKYNDNLTYSCEPPYYDLVDGDVFRTCTENATWSGTEPVCEEITCSNETTYSNSSGALISITGYAYNDSMLYTCEPPYYKLVDGDLARICTENGTWSGKEPVCKRVTCTDEEEHLNISGSLTEISGYSYYDTLTYSCEPPYRKLMQGDLKRSCRQSGNWSGIEPVCKNCMCPCRKTKSKSVFTPAKFEEMVNEMKVNTKNTSKAARRKTSAKDDRPSAKATGCVGIIMFVIAGLVIIVPDLPCLYRDMKRGFYNIKSFLKRFRKKWNT